jgi:glycosyltransferase involved in cell wall biosynthesis
MLEAMMAGKPVVSTDVGEARHMIASGITGILVKPDDIAGMTSTIRDLVAARDLRARMGQAARAAAATEFSAGKMVKAYESLYDAVMAT